MPQISQSDLNPQILYWQAQLQLSGKKKKKKNLVKDFCFRDALALKCALAGAP